MVAAEQIFVQSVSWEGTELDPTWLVSATLTLKINSLAPRLSLTLLNIHNTLLEDWDMAPGGRFRIRFMDRFSEDDAGAIAEFVVNGFYPARNPNHLVFECLEKSAWHLSRITCRVFLKKRAPDILKALLPDAKIDCGRFPVDNDGHLPWERRFNLAARLARELNAVFALDFGGLTFKTKKELYAEADQAVYEHNNTSAIDYAIYKPRLLDRHRGDEEKKRFYMGWNQETGLTVSNVNAGYPARMVSADLPGRLDNIAAITSPSLVFDALGNGKLRPGLPIKLVWHTDIPDRPLDESYPDRALVGQLVHHEQRGLKMNFTTKIYCVV